MPHTPFFAAEEPSCSAPFLDSASESYAYADANASLPNLQAGSTAQGWARRK